MILHSTYVHPGAPKHIKQILTDTKVEIDINTIIVGYFKTPLISMDSQ